MDLTCQCNGNEKYSEEYDSYYCDTCNKWLEDICTDRECLFCKTRPATPKESND